ncbi:hypothetical protein SAMN04488570_3513 [Nocardioides scoriae]|uniref:Uncharacterized protein n=1 Tax=Nocardioides scoriae TaxID=642780 RepID=A0A1H1XJR8_9ACTN|nr:hypothetical protein [Nocardioides scoriae]SDT09545.1 hypothetical protein SAMN04488570_3513 [Nocardioides scoriae]
MADDQLHFASWQRNEVFDRATRVGPRLAGKLALTLTDTDTGQAATGDAPFTLMAAADVGGLKPGAIRHMAPAPYVRDAETTKLVHLDLRDPDLPWRYSPVLAAGDRLAPWLALLVGTVEELVVEGGTVTRVEPSVLVAHDLAQSYRWAHTQQAGSGETIARIVSPRGTEPGADGKPVGLQPQREHVAVLVPTFDDAGQPMWTAAGVLQPGARGSLPAFHSWRFWTAEAGDFETLAAALTVPPAHDVGKARLHYRRQVPADGVDIDATLEVRGAITSLQQPETVQPDLLAAVTSDLDLLDDEIEGTIGLPHYGRPWLPEPDDAPVGWPHDLNDDPRFRGSTGLGVQMGVEAQEALMDAAVAQAGALREAGQRIGFLALGLLAGGRLWDRRLPTDPHARLALLGPMTARMPAAGGGTVLDRVTSDTSPLVPGQFSSAAHRLLRDRTATTRHLAGGGVDRTGALAWANQPDQPADRAPDGVPHVDAVAAQLGLPTIEELFEIDDTWLEEVMAELDQLLDDFRAKYRDGVRSGEDPVQLRRDLAEPLFAELQDRLEARMRERDLPCSASGMLTWIGGQTGNDLFAFLGQVLSDDGAREQLDDLVRDAIRHCMAGRRCRELVGQRRRGFPCEVIVDHSPGPDTETVRPIDLVGLSGIVSQAVDPRGPRPPAKVRLCSRLVGVDCSTLVPTEFPIGLDFPTWSLLQQHDREWLLPGADSLDQDSVTALQTNPTFVDAFMVGINTQFMSEMRWRDLAVARTCTPLRMFWGQVDHTTQQRSADIEPLAEWATAPDDPVGALSHQTIKPHDPANPDGSRLVVVFRSDLFRRYPSTLVYLVEDDTDDAVLTERLTSPPQLDMPPGTPDPEAWRRDREHVGPVFTGTLTPELTFFTFDVTPSTLEQYWLVLDEPPAELRFRNDQPLDTTSAATVARTALDQPTRVAISGQALEDAGLAG